MATSVFCFNNGKQISVQKAIALKQKKVLALFTCIECGQEVRSHAGGGHTKAHFEHKRRNPNCTLSYDQLYKYSPNPTDNSEEHMSQVEQVYKTIKSRSDSILKNDRNWLRELASAKNYVATPDLSQWTFGKSAGVNNKYFADGGAAKNWLYSIGFLNVLTMPDGEFKTAIVSEFLLWASKISSTDILGKFNRDQKGSKRFELLVHETIITERRESKSKKDNHNTEPNNNADLGLEAYFLKKQRINQGVFRKKMINYWGACCVTGVKDQKFLVASHIKPWSKCSQTEKLDRDNGLLLVASYDYLFDNYHLTFSDDGDGLLSDIGKEVSMYFGISNSIQLQKPLNKGQKKYLRHHRREFSSRLKSA